ncbi:MULTISPECIES: DUF4097 family beta strand repeat-containing protein [Streptomyces]|uniref:DUF4097 family beta strand repeat-containing protein n=1 Tax=Streptomyces TaxID=1883 RepID=UPI002248E92D|nr:DUF4097 family beta strand repeat-containing protein [Streptomyces sp. JHD 1]MCX2970466.1 DUF4097 family beta strand repeat-containing protein [Streptomyces sp. JHD 1]
MRAPIRALGVLTAAGVAALTLGACDVGPRSTFQDESFAAGDITAVRLDVDSGSVELRGSEDARGATVERTVRHAGDRPGATHRVEDGVLLLGGCGNDCSVAYTVDLPAGLPVTGSATAGRITLGGVGNVEVRTTSGRIELDGVTGSVEATTTNGRIEGRDLAGGGIRARTSNGAIALTVSAPQDVRAETSNGTIDLTVPNEPYRVSTKTANGATDLAVTESTDAEYHLDLTTSNGGITVDTAS